MKNATLAAVLAPIFVALGVVGPARAGQVYLSLGDSLAFGYDPSDPDTLTPSSGDQGFVRLFADALAVGNGGTRPAVLNLGIAGESSTSFFDPAAISPSGPPRAWQLNLNYPDGATSQIDRMRSGVAALRGQGHEIAAVTLVFGANDVFGLVNSAAFQGASPGQQQVMLGQTIAQALGNYAVVLTELQALAPEARVFLPGYYNPFPAAVAPDQRFLYELILGAFNPGLRSIAGVFDATYVDLYSPFVGRELELTNIAIGDVHPNRAGYEVIGVTLAVASVPEPSSILGLGLGLVGVVVGRRVRAKRSPSV